MCTMLKTPVSIFEVSLAQIRVTFFNNWVQILFNYFFYDRVKNATGFNRLGNFGTEYKSVFSRNVRAIVFVKEIRISCTCFIQLE